MGDKTRMGIGEMKMGKCEIKGKELYKREDFATIYEIKERANTQKNANELRIYCTQFPKTFNLQVRTYKPTDEYQQGVNRNMIANICVNKEDIKAIYDYVMNYEVNEGSKK